MSSPPTTAVPHADHARVVLPFRAGDRTALGEAYLAARGRFPARYARYGIGAAVGEECFQEAVEAMLINFCRSTFVLTCPLEAYLQAIFHRKVLTYLRKNTGAAVRKPLPDDLEAETGDLLVTAEEAERQQRWHRLLRRTFTQLGERCRNLLDLTTERIPAAEIARRLGIPNANAVYQARVRCRQAWDRFIRTDDHFSTSKPERW